MTARRRAVFYARYSTDLQNDRSITDQFAVCDDLARREGYQVQKRYSDEAKTSATMIDRDGLIELWRDAQAKRFDIVVVESLDRVSRDGEDLHGIFKRLSFAGVKIHTVNEGIATAMQVNIRAMQGSMFMKDLADKVWRGQAGRVRDGKIPGGVTYGYRRVAFKPGERLIDDEQAEIVRRIFREFLAGLSPRAISVGLNNDGVSSPRSRAGWNRVYIFNILRNSIYRGEFVWNKSRSVRNPDTGKVTRRAREDGKEPIAAQVPHLRIVSDDEWFAVRDKLQARSPRRSAGNGKVIARPFIARSDWLLAGVLRCGVCSAHMVRGIGRGRVGCASSAYHNTCEHKRSYELDQLTRDVLQAVRHKLQQPDMLKAFVEGYHAEYEQGRRSDKSERAKIAKRLRDIDGAVQRFLTLLERDALPTETVASKLQELEKEKLSLIERERLLGAEVVEFHPNTVKLYAKAIDAMHKALSGGDDIAVEARQMFQALVGAVKVHPLAGGRKRAGRLPFELEIFADVAALGGSMIVQPVEVVAKAAGKRGFQKFDNANTGKPMLPLSKQSLLCLGRWRAAA